MAFEGGTTHPATPARRAAEIGAEGIGKAFGRVAALEDVSMTIGRGEFLTLLGPSGSGKTTLLMILAGFEAPSAGRLALDGRDVTRAPAEARLFGMVFQGYALFPHMTVEENIAFPLRAQGVAGAARRARVGEMIAMVGLGGHERKRPAQLSGGQQQRVALARALAPRPAALLLDEPFSALDKNLRGAMQDEVRRLHRETGTTFVFVTHDQSEALALSSRVAIFERGRLQQVGAPREVYERPANRFVAEFLGDVNILEIEDAAPEGALTAGLFEGQRLACAGAARAPRATLAVRPEHMALHLAPPEGRNAVAARVAELTYQGAETRLTLATPGGATLTLAQPTAALPEGARPGAAVWAAFDPARAFLL